MTFIYFSKLFNNYKNFYAICGIIMSLLLLTIYLIKKYIIFANKFKIIDLPNYRSSHIIPTPRGGGIIIAIVSQIITILLYNLNILPVNLTLAFSCGFILAILGFIDDLINLSVKFRLIAQLVISFIAIHCVFSMSSKLYYIDFINPIINYIPFEILTLNYISQINIYNLNNLLNFVLSFFLLMWSINLFNFMDGTDGLAGVEAVCVLFLGGIIVYLVSKNIGFASYLFLISVIIIGFLKFNWPPARVFMGDVGSYFLGFFIGLSILISHYIYNVSLLYWFILYAVFIADATFTLIKRMFEGKKWYKPHKEHAYQKMQGLGWTHKEILYGLIIINSILGGITLFAYYFKHLWSTTMITYLSLGTLYLYIKLREKKYEKSF